MLCSTMHLPINLDDVLHGQTVEWERLEFKQGWNPEAVLHTMCVFAHDFHNLGGYIVSGVTENQGQPILPPTRLLASQLDAVQKEILEIGHRIQPHYHPVIAPYVVQEKHILVLWCPGALQSPRVTGKGQPRIRLLHSQKLVHRQRQT